MTEEEKQAELDAATAAAEAEAKAKADAEAKPELDPVKEELERVKRKGEGRTELEKLLFSEKKIKERKEQLLKESGLEPEPEEDAETPVTVGMLKKIQKEESIKTSLNLAEDITDENERELVKHHLENTIRPSGNPTEDLKAARAIVNSVKNAQIAEEIQRKTAAKTNSLAGGAPPKKEGDVFEPTNEELIYMKAPFNLSQADIIANREKTAKLLEQ